MSDAREQVLEDLDDESGDRYARETGSNTVSYRKIDRALRTAFSAALDDYVAFGGDRFDEELAIVTAAATGTVAIPGERIAHFKNVRVDLTASGGGKFRMKEGDKAAGGRADLTSRTLVATVVRLFEIPNPAQPDDLLAGVVAGAARSWDAFDAWVCARAADALGAKDEKNNAAVLRKVAGLEKSVRGQKRNPASKPWPERETSSMLLSGDLRWLWFPHEQIFQTVFGGAW